MLKNGRKYIIMVNTYGLIFGLGTKERKKITGSHIFRTILERKIDVFVGTYSDDGNSLFKNKDTGKLIHPGEYGMYREQTFKELLRVITCKDMDISDGFIITSKDEISTQCDIVIYNHNAIPLIDNGIEKFYPIEEVNGIEEVKSDLSYKDF